MSDTIPEGFRLLRDTGGDFMGVNGPLYFRKDGERLFVGMRVEPRHCNPMGNCHGGMLMTFADMALPMSANYQHKLRQFLPTVSMTADFVGPAKLGSWLEACGEVLKVTRNLVFVQAVISADGEPVVRASATFKRGPTIEQVQQQRGG